MEGLRTHPPTVLFRAATLVGCVALLLGVAGIFYFGGRDGTRSAALPKDAATVLLRGDTDGALGVTVTWRSVDGATDSEDGAPGAEPGHWTFREAPEGTPLTLRVLRTQGERRAVLHEQHAIFTYGAGFEVYVRAP